MNITLTSEQLHQIIKEEIKKELKDNDQIATEIAIDLLKKFSTLEEQEEDVEKLAQLLKFMVGKTIKARGDRFVITKDDIQEALGLIERELTKGEEKDKEKFVKGMKKNKDDFKQRYGKDAEAVMYATATKMAKK